MIYLRCLSAMAKTHSFLQALVLKHEIISELRQYNTKFLCEVKSLGFGVVFHRLINKFARYFMFRHTSVCTNGLTYSHT